MRAAAEAGERGKCSIKYLVHKPSTVYSHSEKRDGCLGHCQWYLRLGMDQERHGEAFHYGFCRYRDVYNLDFIFWVLVRSEIPRVPYPKETILDK